MGDFLELSSFYVRYSTLFHDSSASPQIPLCQRMLGSTPGQLRRHWLSDALTTRLDLIHKLGLISSRNSARSIGKQPGGLPSGPDGGEGVEEGSLQRVPLREVDGAAHAGDDPQVRHLHVQA